MREIHLHDTRSGQLVKLQPRDPGAVGIYACGPTVYSRIHIGNGRPFVVFSVLKRFLEHEGYVVKLVMNVTDVNDKIYAAARAADPSAAGQQQSSAELAKQMSDHYVGDTDALGLGRPDAEPFASQSMDAIIAYIQDLIERGCAYAVAYEQPAGASAAQESASTSTAGGPVAASDVYFHVRSDPAYGSLSHRKVDDMDQGEGVEGSDRKRDHLDFALWKARKADEDVWWDSPWGPGRPGWHIECSAMAEGELGIGFDIHGGGSDLIFPHHENEAAQSRCARGQELASIWMHNGMIQLTGEKMAKSQGNIALLHELTGRYGGDAVVLYLLSGHYRQPLSFSEAAMAQAAQRVQRIREALRRTSPGQASPAEMADHSEQFFAALADDFNTPKALAALFGWVREANRRADLDAVPVGERDLREMLDVLGMGNLHAEGGPADGSAEDGGADELLRLREQARAARDFAQADELREQLRRLGFDVRDSATGPELLAIDSKG